MDSECEVSTWCSLSVSWSLLTKGHLFFSDGSSSSPFIPPPPPPPPLSSVSELLLRLFIVQPNIVESRSSEPQLDETSHWLNMGQKTELRRVWPSHFLKASAWSGAACFCCWFFWPFLSACIDANSASGPLQLSPSSFWSSWTVSSPFWALYVDLVPQEMGDSVFFDRHISYLVSNASSSQTGTRLVGWICDWVKTL